MKKLFLILIIGLFFAGCGTAAKESEFWQHSTMYKDWDHLKFSWYGYKTPTIDTLIKSQDQQWWGKPISWKPGK